MHRWTVDGGQVDRPRLCLCGLLREMEMDPTLKLGNQLAPLESFDHVLVDFESVKLTVRAEIRNERQWIYCFCLDPHDPPFPMLSWLSSLLYILFCLDMILHEV